MATPAGWAVLHELAEENSGVDASAPIHTSSRRLT